MRCVVTPDGDIAIQYGDEADGSQSTQHDPVDERRIRMGRGVVIRDLEVARIVGFQRGSPSVDYLLAPLCPQQPMVGIAHHPVAVVTSRSCIIDEWNRQA